MGEEWAASTPFQFFVDFESDPDLAKAVREGRRGEFAHFKAFADPEASQRIPDPTDRATYERSRIDWMEAGRPPHREILAETRNLLELRRREILPLIRSAYRGSQHRASAENTLEVTWSFEGGSLRLIANFGDKPMDASADEAAQALWSSPGVSRSGANLRLPSWTAAILKGASA
jgi:maltooligosyltrehalose trehalohydrolase